MLNCNISNMRRSFLSPDETPRRELKIRREVEYFLTNFQVFYLVMKHYVELFILLLKKKKLRMQKLAVFPLISKHSPNFHGIFFIINEFEKVQ